MVFKLSDPRLLDWGGAVLAEGCLELAIFGQLAGLSRLIKANQGSSSAESGVRNLGRRWSHALARGRVNLRGLCTTIMEIKADQG
jgi:hypothetical protein